jgi:hypothetical protein
MSAPQPLPNNSAPPIGDGLTPQQRLARRRERYGQRPAQKKDLLPIVQAIRDIQQQLNITPLLRLRIVLGPDEGDDDFTG